ncbi:hypothetical protein ACLKA6_016455 [Drosophila palustris]
MQLRRLTQGQRGISTRHCAMLLDIWTSPIFGAAEIRAPIARLVVSRSSIDLRAIIVLARCSKWCVSDLYTHGPPGVLPPVTTTSDRPAGVIQHGEL